MSNQDFHHFRVGADRLQLGHVIEIARNYQEVPSLTAEVEARVQESAEWVKEVVKSIEDKRRRGEKADPYYGINTGFGALAGKSALDSEYLTKVLSRNLIASHSVGVGEYFDQEIVRAAMLIRAHTLAQGYSGVRPLIIQKLIQMLNQRVYPAIPAKGSLGASGDLAPLSHLALVMCKVPTPGPTDQDLRLDATSGEAFVPNDEQESGSINSSVTYHITRPRTSESPTLWRRVSGEEAMARVGGQVELLAKEGLALNNGATFSAAIAALTLSDAINLLANSELALSMTLEAIRGFRDPFLPEVHQVRGHPGARISAKNVLQYVQGSKLVDPGDQHNNPKRIPPQDFYSVRCAPQVLGTVRDTLEFVQKIVETELNGATDNPLIFMSLPKSRTYKTISGGNFHGEPIAMAMDFLGIAITELGNIAERRVFRLTDYGFSNPEDQAAYGLEGFLIEGDPKTEGLNSGVMLLQYTAAALVSDCKTLAHPDSVDSIPSSANKEDHVSMSLNAARHAREIVDNIEAVIAIEYLCAAQALSLRLNRGRAEGKEIRLGKGTRAAYQHIRGEVRYLDFDRVLYPDIRVAIQLVRSGELVRQAQQAINGKDESVRQAQQVTKRKS